LARQHPWKNADAKLFVHIRVVFVEEEEEEEKTK